MSLFLFLQLSSPLAELRGSKQPTQHSLTHIKEVRLSPTPIKICAKVDTSKIVLLKKIWPSKFDLGDFHPLRHSQVRGRKEKGGKGGEFVLVYCPLRPTQA